MVLVEALGAVEDFVFGDGLHLVFLWRWSCAGFPLSPGLSPAGGERKQMASGVAKGSRLDALRCLKKP